MSRKAETSTRGCGRGIGLAPSWISRLAKSCHDTPKPFAKSVNKRLETELGSLRNNLCRERGKALPQRRMLEDTPEQLSDLCRWTDTTVLVADRLNKLLKEYHFFERCREHLTGEVKSSAISKADKYMLLPVQRLQQAHDISKRSETAVNCTRYEDQTCEPFALTKSTGLRGSCTDNYSREPETW